MPIDSFASFATSLNDPARDAVAIVPNDTAALPALPRAIYVGTGGHIALRCVDAVADVTFRNLASGQILDVRASHVRATGTTASDLIGLA